MELLPSSHIHAIFHVSYLKKFIGTNIRAQTILLKLDSVDPSFSSQRPSSIGTLIIFTLDQSQRQYLCARHATKGCYMGTTPSDSTTISTSKALGKIFSKREGMLGTHVKPSLYFFKYIVVGHICFASHPASILYYPTFTGSNSCLD